MEKMQLAGFALKLDEAAVAWRATRHPGIEWFPLWTAPGDGAREATVLIRMAPGRGYPPHRHLDVEEVLVLAGGYRDADGEHRAGSYLRYPPGSVHAPVALGDARAPVSAANPSCLLFALARGGVENLG